MNIASPCCPSALRSLVDRGHQVIVQAGAGLGSGSARPRIPARPERKWLQLGADDVFAQADLVVKVKEPQTRRVSASFAPGQLLFTYFHFAASKHA